jgi:hypothetical protein
MASNVLPVCFRGSFSFNTSLLHELSKFRELVLVASEFRNIRRPNELEVPGQGFDSLILPLCAQHAMIVGHLAITLTGSFVHRVGTLAYVNS